MTGANTRMETTTTNSANYNGSTSSSGPSAAVASGLRDLRRRIGEQRAQTAEVKTAAESISAEARQPTPKSLTVTVSPATTRRETNRELLTKVLTAATSRERDRAAETLRRQIKTVCAAAIDRYGGRNLSAQESEDLTQEVFLRLLQAGRCDDAAPQEATIDPSPAYISRIAVNLLIDRQRFMKRRGLSQPGLSLEENDGATLIPDPHPSVEELVVGQMHLRDLRATLTRSLSPMEAEVLWRRGEGASHEEIAAELGIQQANARKHAERGIKRLKRLIESGQFTFPLAAAAAMPNRASAVAEQMHAN